MQSGGKASPSAQTHTFQTQVLPSSSTDDVVQLVEDKNGGRTANVKFNASKDLILIKEIHASNAHGTTYGNLERCFMKLAEKENVNRCPRRMVNTRSIKDHFRKIMNTFNKEKARDHNHSGSGGELGEMNELLLDMTNAIERAKDLENAYRKENDNAEQAKLAAGKRMMDLASDAVVIGDDPEGEGGEDRR